MADEANNTAAASSSSLSSSRAASPAPPSPLPAHPRSIILGVAVVDFNHLQGPIVEWAHPPELASSDHADLTSSLPFCALPDGSHLSDEDFAHFHLLCPSISPHSTVFGISCNRQIAADKLLVKGKDVTRSTVQKAVVVLARQPVFAPLRDKLGIVTRAYFAQGDLAERGILVDFYDTLDAGLRAAGLRGDEGEENDSPTSGSGQEVEGAPPPAAAQDLREGVMYMGTSLRELIYKFRFKTLILVKLLLLQRRIMFFGYPVERLCVYEYTLVSLIPGLLLSLSDCSSPDLDYTQRHKLSIAEDVKTSDRKSLLRFCGCPLRLFGQGAFFQPYLPLQQIDLLKASSWLVGTTNLIFRQQKEYKPDVVVDLEHCSLDFAPVQHAAQQHQRQSSEAGPASAAAATAAAAAATTPASAEPSLAQIVSLTPADRKWMDELVNVVVESYNPEDPSRPTTMRFEGSEDWLRAKFESYVCAMLSCVKYSEFLDKSNPAAAAAALTSPSQTSLGGTLTPNGGHATTLSGTKTSTAGIDAPDSIESIRDFNPLFLSAFKRTRAYEVWSTSTSPVLFDLVPYRHPCAGRVSALEDVGLRLSAGLHDLRIEEQVRDTREYVEKAGRGLFSMAERFGSEVAKRRRDWIAQQQAAQAAAAAAEGTSEAGEASSAEKSAATTALATSPGATVTAVDDITDHNRLQGSGSSSGSGTADVGGAGAGGSGLDAARQTFAPHAAAAQQAAMQAGTEVRAALGRFGSYLGSRGWGASQPSTPSTPRPPSAPPRSPGPSS